MSQSQELIESLVRLAREADRAILEIYDTDFEVEDKRDESPLTQADMASHRTIVSGLRELTPEIPVMSEESADIDPAERREWQRFWLVDPLDGTKEFIKRNGEFTVNIALIEQGRPVLGVVTVPARGLAYHGSLDGGAWRREGDAPAQPIRVRQLGEGPAVAVASRSHKTPELQQYLDAMGEHTVRSIGSSLKFCLVAEGEADIYPRFGPTSEWDTAAAQAIVEAAGGHVVDVSGQPLRYNRGESVLNPSFLVYGDARHDWTAYIA